MVDTDAAIAVSGKPALAVAVVHTSVVVGLVARMFAAGSYPSGEQNLLGMSSK